MHSATKSKVVGVALCLLLVFIGAFLLHRQEKQFAGLQIGKDLQAAALAMKQIRKQVKSVISSPEDPLARFNFEYRRLRDPRTGKIPANIRQKELIFSATIPVAEAFRFSTTHPGARGQVLGWENRGPYNIGGRTRALALDVSNENIILAGGVSGGMWRSADGGATWVKTTDPTLLQSVTTVSQDKRAGKTNTWYYGTGELVGNSAAAVQALYRGNGIYKSTDNGVSWLPLPATVTNATNITDITSVFQWVWRVAANPANASQDEVLAATIGGIQRSVDGGVTWNPVLGTSDVAQIGSHTRYTDLAISATGVMYATLSQANNNERGGTARVRGIYRSVNGRDWTDITPEGWPQVYERVVLDIAAADENVVYFLAHTPASGKFDTQLWKYTYRSGSGQGPGGTWENRTANIPGFGGSVGDYDHQENYNMMIAVKPDNSNQVFIGGTNLYYSADGFASAANTRWIGGYARDNSTAMYPQHHPDQHALLFYPANVNRAISAHDGGLSRTGNLLATDTVRWESLNRGYLTTQFTSVAIDPDATQDDFILGGMQDNGSWATESESAAATWFSLLTGDGAFGAAVGNSLFVSAQNGFIIRYAFNRQGEFQGYARVDPKGGGGYLFLNPYVIDPNNEYVMYLPAGDTLWRNNNIDAIPVGQGDAFTEPGTTNWKVISTLSGQSVSAIAISKSPANMVYLGTSSGQMYKLTNALASDSPTRTTITSPAFPSQGYISSIAVDPINGNNVVVTFSNYGVVSVFQSTNGGNSWSAIAGNLEQHPDGSGNGPAVKWVNILPAKRNDPAKYFVGTSTGLYATSSPNGAATIWVKEGTTTIGNIPVDMVISRSTDNLVVVGTHGNGVYSHYYNEPLAAPMAEKPGNFELYQNYPNPVRTSTTIGYRLAQAGKVSLKVLDLSGRELASLVSAYQAAGTHKVLWQGQSNSGRRLANGLYLYRLEMDNQAATRQMLLLP